MIRKFLCLVMCFAMSVTVLAGCGGSGGNGSTGDVTISQSTSNVGTSSTSDSEGTAKKTVQAGKKIIIVKEVEDAVRTDAYNKALAALAKGGYTKDNSEITEIKLNNDPKNCPGAVDKIKEINPDVVLIEGTQSTLETIVKPLEGTGIPIVVYGGVESYVGQNGKPNNSITGVYGSPKDLTLNSVELLNKISPLNGKKAVFLTVGKNSGGIHTKEGVENDLGKIGIKLKAYIDTETVEDYQQAVIKYNNDDEVGWILVGVWPTKKRDKTSITFEDAAKWDSKTGKSLL